MMVLFLLYYLNQSGFGDAAPISSIQQHDTSSCGDSNGGRTIWDIVWSCFSTIFLCTWVTVHPNIAFTPDRHDMDWDEWLWEPLRMFWTHKLPLFLWTLIFPEWILAWSVRQRVMAGKIAKQSGTTTHGFFVIMGGFHLFERPSLAENTDLGSNPDLITPLHNPRNYETPLHPLGIEDLPKDLIIPTEKEIKGRGKSDGLAKAIVLIQTSWFVTQCIARGIKHLHITELEIVTLAYTMMNFSIYMFWWHKPRDVGCPFRVYEKLTVYEPRVFKMPSGIIGILMKLVIDLQGIEGEFIQLADCKDHLVPMFWSGMSSMDPDDARLVSMYSSLGPATLGIGFGATHFIAWLYEFPSHTELVLWRISCIAMVVLLVMGTLVCTAFMSMVRSRKAGNDYCFFFDLGMILGILTIIIGLMYLFARTATIVVAFTTLRSLPDDAFKVVDWTTFIPHI